MTESQRISVIYHSLFAYSLSKKELKRWEAGKKLQLRPKGEGLVIKKLLPKLYSLNPKLKIAHSAANLLSKIPTVLFVGITGSLAMNNAKPKSDIDLMIITRVNSLWITRIIVYFLLITYHISLRTPKNKNEADKLCLNLWIDETALGWNGHKNAYIAHEIAQVVPLVNKNNIYERWITKNSWIKGYWPNATVIRGKGLGYRERKLNPIPLTLVPFNFFCFVIQKLYMSPKLTRETVTLHKAFFHPYDWGEKVLKELKKRGVEESVK